MNHSSIFLLLLLTSFIGYGQKDKLFFDHFNVQDGLPEASVNSLLQDEQGFIWIGTQNGLVKYDGYDFKAYQAIAGDTTGSTPSGHYFRDIMQTKNGHIWAGTAFNGGLTNFDPNTEQFTNYYNEKEEETGLYFGSYTLLMEDSKGRIWLNAWDISNDTMRIECFDPKTKSFTQYPIEPALIWYYRFSFWAIAEGSNGDIWIGDGSKGIYKIAEGKADPALLYPLNAESGNTLAASSLNHIMVDKKDRMWVSTPNGLRIINLNDQEVTAINYNTLNINSIANDTVIISYEDNRGNIWVSTQQGALNRFNEKNQDLQRFTLEEGPLKLPEKMPMIFGTCPVVENENGIWFLVGTLQRSFYYFYYDHHTEKFTGYDGLFNNSNNIANSFPGSALLDENGLLWIGNWQGGGNRQNPTANRIERFNHDSTNPGSLASDTIISLLEDSRGNLWVATPNGLSRYDHQSNTFESFHLKGRNRRWFSYILEDTNEQIWIGSAQGLQYFDRETNQLIPFLEKFGGIEPMETDANGNIWLRYEKGGIGIFNPNTKKIEREFFADPQDTKSIQSNRINRIFRDSKNRMWLGSRDGLSRYNPSGNNFILYQENPNDPGAISDNSISTIIEDSKGRIWVGTIYNGLNLFLEESSSFRQYYDYRNGIVLIRSVQEDRKGNLWLTTFPGSGLHKLDPETERFEAFSIKDGLVNNSVAYTIEDDLGYLWLPTENGLSRFNPEDQTFKNFGEQDGFKDFEYNFRYNSQKLNIKTKNGDIWIGHTAGLHRIQPQKLLNPQSNPPQTWITSLGVGDQIYSGADGNLLDQHISFSKSISLAYNQDDLTFSYVGLHYARPSDNQYTYILEHFDDNWSKPSADRKVRYNNLDPGEYIFRVKASNADGIWDEAGKSLRIIINPPWWQTWWAYGLYGLGATALVFWGFSIQRRRVVEAERLKNQEKELAQAKEIEKAYRKLEETHSNLKSTQTQLIQAEKMASLGELTAGIAHEIQNPLNFVNNFSDVNIELAEELEEEIIKGDLEEARVIIKDLKSNEEKINHHGKRADAIVKGMLQHSRSSTGQKEPTDINALCDEYLRLAYHGLRAKDSSFNADFSTEFDPELPKVNVIPQDTGRVLLNLINNAFYAVNERSQKSKEDYQPLVKILTKRTSPFQGGSEGVEISVTDNGPGIPDAIKDKIFQPFFTTKPTGQGTGLGLSLSYDIVKAHGGELTVSSEKGVGSQFTVKIPQGN